MRIGTYVMMLVCSMAWVGAFDASGSVVAQEAPHARSKGRGAGAAAPGKSGSIIRFSINAMQAADPGVRIEKHAEQIKFTTLPSWASYALVHGVPADLAYMGSAVMRVQLEVTAGVIGVGFYSRQNVGEILKEELVASGKGRRTVAIPIANMSEFGGIVLRNMSKTGASKAVFYAAGVNKQ